MPARKIDKVQVACPHCGHRQAESRLAISTNCRKCGQYFSLEKKAKAPARKRASAKPKAAASARNVKKFAAPQSHDFTISDNSGVIGQVRVKPNAVAWKPKRGKAFHQISLEQLAAFAAEHGRQVQN